MAVQDRIRKLTYDYALIPDDGERHEVILTTPLLPGIEIPLAEIFD